MRIILTSTLIILLTGAATAGTLNQNSICPASNFSDFFYKFIASQEIQEKFSSPEIIYQALDISNLEKGSPYTKPSSIDKKILKNKIGYLNSANSKPYIAWRNTSNAEGYMTSFDSPELKTSFNFRFEKSCWQLTKIVDLSLPSPLLTGKDAQKAHSCISIAERYERLAETHQQEEPSHFYDLALYAYLCAAENGSANAALRAAQIGESGQSRTLPSKYIEKLIIWSAQSNPESMAAAAELKCGDTSPCQEPSESYRYITRAIAYGNRAAINTLGIWLERGMLGKADIPRALACFQLGKENGSEISGKNLKRLREKHPDSQASTHCID